MDAKYNKIKKMMSDENPPVPPKLAWEEMEAGILHKMEEIETNTPATPFFRAKRGLFLLLLLGMAILLIPLICSRSENDIAGVSYSEGQGLAPQGQFQTPLNKSKSSSTNTSKNHTPALELPAQQSDFSNTKSIPKTTGNKKTLASPKSIITTAIDHNAAKSSLPATQNQATSTDQIQPPISPIANPSQQAAPQLSTSTSNQINNTTENTSSQVAKEKSQLALFTPLPTKQILLRQPVIALEQIKQIPLARSATKQEKILKPSPRVAVHSGLSFWNMGYSGPIPERQAFEQTIPSFHVQVNYLHPLPQNFTALLGIQYQRLESRFDWNGRIDKTTITLQDTIIRIEVNALTREETEIRGDVDLEVAAERQVRSFNSIQMYQIPFALGKTWRKKNWESDLLLGGTLNFTTLNKGKTLYQGQVSTYEGTSTDFFANEWNVQAMLMGRLSYRLTEHLGISTGVQLQKALGNWSMEANGKMRPGILNLELGLSYAW